MIDWCPVCRRPEAEHTTDELQACWLLIEVDADLSTTEENEHDDD